MNERHSNLIDHVRSLGRQMEEYDARFRLSQAFDIAKKSLLRLGFDWDELGIELVNLQDNRQVQSGRTFDIDPPQNVRIKVNLWKDGIETYRILFHEIGHALHFKHVDPSLPPILRGSMPSHCTEALAQVIEFLVFDDDWQKEYTDLTEAERLNLRSLHVAYDLLRHRRDIAIDKFERLIYENDSLDLEDLLSKVNKEVLFPEADDKEDLSDLCNRIHQLVNQPVSAAVIILTAISREHIRAFIVSKSGGLFATNRQFLMPFYREGNLKEWDDLIQEITGERLNSKYLADYFTINSSGSI